MCEGAECTTKDESERGWIAIEFTETREDQAAAEVVFTTVTATDARCICRWRRF